MNRLITAAVAGLLAGAALMAWHETMAPPALRTVWCVRQGYPASLAVPFVTGPGTGLPGCPAGDRQVAK